MSETMNEESTSIQVEESQNEEKGPFEDLIEECKLNSQKLEKLMILKDHEYQLLSRELSELQDAIWECQKEEYEERQITTDLEIKREIEGLQKVLAEKEEQIEVLEKEISAKTAEGELVRLRSKYKETQTHKEIHIRRLYKTGMAGENEIFAGLRLQVEELKHEIDAKKAIRDRQEEELKKSDDAIKELRRRKREGASLEHQLEEEIENFQKK